MDSSFDIKNKLLKFSVLIFHIVIHGTVSQILFIKALVLVLCDLENDVFKFYKMFPVF